MKKLPVILASISLLTLSIAPVFAEDTMTTEVVTPTTAATNTTTTTSTATTTLKKVARPLLQTTTANTGQTVKDAMSAAKDAFKAKLATIKDEQKKTVVENIDNRISTVNQNRTDEMMHALTKLSEILDRISSKSATAKIAGESTTTLDKDIASAKAAVALAQSAVTTQAANVYTINITTETKLRTNVMTTLASFRKDLQAVYKKVVTAREGVRVAALDLEKLNSAKVGITETPTPTASNAATNQ